MYLLDIAYTTSRNGTCGKLTLPKSDLHVYFIKSLFYSQLQGWKWKK